MDNDNPNKKFKGRKFLPNFGLPSKQSIELNSKSVEIELTLKEQEELIERVRELNREYEEIIGTEGFNRAKERLFKNGYY